MTNYYEILGVRDKASDAEIKRAYRRLVKIYHPDINPSDEAGEKIVEITSAYEVLSDPQTKYEFDRLFFEGLAAPAEFVTESPEEVARRAYRQQRQAEERERLARQYRIKVRFYNIQRKSCYLFLLVSILFTVDYLYKPNYDYLPVSYVSLEQKGKTLYSIIQTDGGRQLESTRGVYDHFDPYHYEDLRIHYSSVFGVEAEVAVKYKGAWQHYPLYGSLHEFGNFFGYLVMLICLVVIRQKEYADWALTVAIIPFFVSLFLFLMV